MEKEALTIRIEPLFLKPLRLHANASCLGFWDHKRSVSIIVFIQWQQNVNYVYIHMHTCTQSHVHIICRIKNREEWMLWDGVETYIHSFIRTTLEHVCEAVTCKKVGWEKFVNIFKLKTCLYSRWLCITHKSVLFLFTYV